MPGRRHENPMIRPLRIDHSKLQHLLSLLTPEQWSQPITRQEFTPKDLLALVIAHEQEALQTVEMALRNIPFASEYTDLAEFDQRVVNDNRTRPVGDLIEMWDQSYAKLIAAISLLTPSDLSPESKVSKLAGAPIQQVIGNNTFGFYSGCREKIKKTLKPR